MRAQFLADAFPLSALAAPAFGLQGLVSDDQVAQQIIKELIANYPRPCARPYNHARTGSSCGRRSAYSRVGGYDTVCYREDVSADDIMAYREQHGLAAKRVAQKRSQWEDQNTKRMTRRLCSYSPRRKGSPDVTKS